MVKQYPLRIDSELKKQLEDEAKKQKRSFNNFVEVVLTQHMDKITDQKMELK
jgi:predicted HicB family RNase H-like nuclease